MTGEIASLAAGIIAGGIVTGILAGLFGIGGGAIIVPVLYEVIRIFGVPDSVRMQLRLGTSLAIIVPMTLRSYRVHKTRGLVLPDVMRHWALPSMVGVAVGSVLAAIAPADTFKAAFIVIAGAIAAKLLVGGERWVIGTALPGAAVMKGYGFVIGLASSLMGIAGGSLVAMVLTLYGRPIHNPVATAPGLGVPITVAGTIGYVLAGLPHLALLPPLSLGFVSVVGLVLVAHSRVGLRRSGECPQPTHFGHSHRTSAPAKILISHRAMAGAKS
jgi:uncharacterized membrane protein YfcA